MRKLLAATLLIGTASAGRAAETSMVAWPADGFSQAVFFAVLEGLYADGVPNDAVDLVLAGNPQVPGGYDHFVYACPLCSPALEAFRVYRTRPKFLGLKGGPRDTFGNGPTADLTARLSSPVKQERLDAIQGLIEAWVGRRLEAQRLTEEERAEWTQAMEERRKLGMKQLGQRADWKNCAICDGSAGACRWKRPAGR